MIPYQRNKKRKAPQNVGAFLAGIGRIKKSAGYNWGDEVGVNLRS